eukprot:jgi/Bigna1/68089/fgenesh1_pg.5_\
MVSRGPRGRRRRGGGRGRGGRRRVGNASDDGTSIRPLAHHHSNKEKPDRKITIMMRQPTEDRNTGDDKVRPQQPQHAQQLPAEQHSSSSSRRKLIITSRSTKHRPADQTTQGTLSSSSYSSSRSGEIIGEKLIGRKKKKKGEDSVATITTTTTKTKTTPVAATAASLPSSSISSSATASSSAPSRCIKPVPLVSKRFAFQGEELERFLLKQSDFTVVGIVGLEGSGKSTLLSQFSSSPSASLFKSQSLEHHVSGCRHCTEGIQAYVTEERVVLLDTQPVLSASVLAKMIEEDVPCPASSSISTLFDFHALQQVVFLMCVCHVVLVCATFDDERLPLWRLLETAEMLKGTLSSSSSNIFMPQTTTIRNFNPDSAKTARVLKGANTAGAMREGEDKGERNEEVGGGEGGGGGGVRNSNTTAAAAMTSVEDFLGGEIVFVYTDAPADLTLEGLRALSKSLNRFFAASPVFRRRPVTVANESFLLYLEQQRRQQLGAKEEGEEEEEEQEAKINFFCLPWQQQQHEQQRSSSANQTQEEDELANHDIKNGDRTSHGCCIESANDDNDSRGPCTADSATVLDDIIRSVGVGGLVRQIHTMAKPRKRDDRMTERDWLGAAAKVWDAINSSRQIGNFRKTLLRIDEELGGKKSGSGGGDSRKKGVRSGGAGGGRSADSKHSQIKSASAAAAEKRRHKRR